MEAADIEEMGPIDYVLIEWADSEPTGEAVPIVLDLVDRGIISSMSAASTHLSSLANGGNNLAGRVRQGTAGFE